MENQPKPTAQDVQERVRIIEQALATARQRLRTHIGDFFLWGTLVVLAGIIHYWIMAQQHPRQWIPWTYGLLFGGATLVVWLYHARKGASARPASSRGLIFAVFGLLLGGNMFAVGMLAGLFGAHTFLVHLLIFAMAMMGWAAALRSWALTIGALGINALAYLSLWVPFAYHPLLFSFAGVVGLIIPGMILKMQAAQHYQ